MDVMRPDVYRIGRCVYRRNPINPKYLSDSVAGSSRPYEEEDPDEFRRQFDEGDEEEDPAGLSQLANGSWQLVLPLPCQLFPALIGRRAETKKRLEVDTRTQMTVPRQGTQGPVTVTGRDRRGVLAARSQITLLADSARTRLPFTHFLSIPIGRCAPALLDAFADFRAQALDFCGGDRGVSAGLFQAPAKLHLTLGVLTLLDEREVASAARELEESAAKLKDLLSEPLLVDCVGLEYMNDDPTEVDVLYMKVNDREGRLQELADTLVQLFVTSNLMRRQYDAVKLHVTLMNTLFRRDATGSEGEQRAEPRRVPRESFDASGLLKRFGDFEFAKEVPITEIHLSQRFSSGQDGYYSCAASIKL